MSRAFTFPPCARAPKGSGENERSRLPISCQWVEVIEQGCCKVFAIPDITSLDIITTTKIPLCRKALGENDYFLAFSSHALHAWCNLISEMADPFLEQTHDLQTRAEVVGS